MEVSVHQRETEEAKVPAILNLLWLKRFRSIFADKCVKIVKNDEFSVSATT